MGWIAFAVAIAMALSWWWTRRARRAPARFETPSAPPATPRPSGVRGIYRVEDEAALRLAGVEARRLDNGLWLVEFPEPGEIEGDAAWKLRERLRAPNGQVFIATPMAAEDLDRPWVLRVDAAPSIPPDGGWAS